MGDESLHCEDGERLLISAVDHRMTGLLWSAVTDGRVVVPDEIVARLAAADLAETAHHRRLWQVLERAVDALAAAGIATVAFKGVTDEMRWFDRMGERPCSDIDILVTDHERFDDAISVLAPQHPLIGQASDIARRGHLKAVDLLVDDVFIDLHVDPIKVGAGWRRPEVWLEHTTSLTSPDGVELQVLDPEASATLKLLHLGRDRFRDLLGLVEAQRLLDSGISWDTVGGLARVEGIEAPVGVAAEVVAQELGRPRTSTVGGWRARMWRALWAPQVRLQGQVGRRRHIRRSQWGLPLAMPGRTMESLWWLVRSTVPPEPLFDLKHPRLSGPYPWRLTAGRMGYLMRRRLDTRRSRRRGD